VEVERASGRESENRIDTVSEPDRRKYLTILSLFAAAFMIFQIGVLRELRFQLNTIFTLAPFLFSSVIAFIGLGSLTSRWIKGDIKRVLRWAVTILPLILLPLFAVTILVATLFSPLQPQGVTGAEYMSSVITAFVLVAVLGYGPVFFLQGMLFALYFREGRSTGILSSVYAVDLLASGAGALVGGVLLFVATPIQMVIVASGILLINLLIAAEYLNISQRLVVGEVILLLLLVLLEQTSGVMQLAESLRWRETGLAYSTWSPYRRIDVLEDQERLQVYTDGLMFHMYEKDEQAHWEDPRSLPVRLMPTDLGREPEVLVIGAGTGADVRIIRDLHPGDPSVVAVEIDGGFIETAQAFDWLWDYYRTAEIVVEEGRYYIENSDRQFDMVIYAYVDPQSAISKIGIPDANFLYTDRAIRRAYERVRDGGILAITRVFLVHQEESFVGRLVATLEAAGISPSQTSIYRIQGSFPWSYYGRLSTIHVFVRKGGEAPVVQDPRLTSLAWAPGDRATTDFYPFSLVTQAWFGTLAEYVLGSPLTLILIGIVALGLIVRLSTSVGHVNFFLLGFGSFLVESLVLFNSFLLIGNPSLSAAVAIGFFLIWNAVGSRLSDRLERSSWFYALVPIAVLAYAATAPLLNGLTIAHPVALRTAVFSIHLALVGIVVGAMFPISLRSFTNERVSSMFFIDLIGCAIAPIAFWLAMSVYGTTLVSVAGVVSYVTVSLILFARLRAA
jgi:spermidine synthase